ncbi:MAG TPA: stage II sporulation protein M, partial [Jatrophihabitantaceae bacterium]|nr:stage II sporulation protein M [Jatrophihabitantaceae bacterium]
MDLDAFVSQHGAEWRRLDELSRRRRLSADEVDQLVVLYQRAATQLSVVQSRMPDPLVSARLSGLLARARAATVGGSRNSGWAALAHGITVDFPVAVYLAWRWWCAVATAGTVVALSMMLYLRDHPERVGRLISSADVRQLVQHDFAGYYSAHPAQS